MPEQVVNGVRLHYEEHGAGAPIALIHGCGGSALGFADAVEKLAELGRVIAYDRRGCARSERPRATLPGSGAGACPVGARRATRARAGGRRVGGRIGRPSPQVSTQAGVDAVGEALITEVAGESAWRSFPDEWRRVVIDNGPAILAELEGEWWLEADAAELATIKQPALLVAAADSPPEYHEPVRSNGGRVTQRAQRAGRGRPHHRSRGTRGTRLHRGGGRATPGRYRFSFRALAWTDG